MLSSTIFLNYILLIKTRFFNISTDSSSSNIFFIFISNLLQVIERTIFFKKMYDVSGFLNFLYLPQIRLNFFILTFLVITILHYSYLNIELPNEFLMIHTHQNLLHMTHPLVKGKLFRFVLIIFQN